MDTNLNEIRNGRFLMTQAHEFAQKQIKGMDEEDMQSAYENIKEDRFQLLVLQQNEQDVRNMPGSHLIPTDENGHVKVLRYQLKDGVSEDDATKTVREYMSAANDADDKKSETQLNEVLSKSFNVIETTMDAAFGERSMFQNPSDAIAFKYPKTPVENGVAKETVKPAGGHNPFADITISAEQLAAQLESQGYTYSELASLIDIHHFSVKSWLKNGVPAEHIEKVIDALK